MVQETTVKTLIEDIRGGFSHSVSTLIDYYGTHNINNDNFIIIKGVYRDLIVSKNCVDDFFLHKCFLENRLDELIHKKFQNIKSQYYNKFVEKNIQIGATNLLVKKNTNTFEIYSDDYCPCCNTIGFFTQKHSVQFHGGVPDCEKCFKQICIKCSKPVNDKIKYIRRCSNCKK